MTDSDSIGRTSAPLALSDINNINNITNINISQHILDGDIPFNLYHPHSTMTDNSISALPADLLHLLAAELADRLDFGTLFNVVVSSKMMATAGAITALYRISHNAPVKGGGQDLSLSEQELIVQRWSIFWRTVALSAFGKTLYPYCKHLRFLDLRDLGNLLEDDKFRGKISKHFFSGELAQFHFVRQIPGRGRASRLDINKIISAIGDAITRESPLLEELSEPTSSNIFAGSLVGWAPRLEHLKALVLWDGKMFADEQIRNLLHVHCPSLSNITIYCSTNEDADHQLAAFVSGMPTLTKFENINNCRIGAETCLALNSHGKNLKSLIMNLKDEGIQALALLQDCTALECLELSSVTAVPDLKATQNDIYLSIIGWLKECSSLQEVSIYNFVSAPDLLLPILLNGKTALQKLQINTSETANAMYVVKDHHDFHRALSQQASLHTLLLRADPEPASRDDKEILLTALCSIRELRKMTLTRISDYFSDPEIELLAQSLPNLEDLYIGGLQYTDKALPSLAKLDSLKSVSFAGITTFSDSGILDFISSLDEGHRGFVLSMEFADPDTALSAEGIELIRDVMAERLDGKFEYQLSRDPNVPQFYGSDSDDSD